MLEHTNKTLKVFLDSIRITSPISREHYLQRCWPVVDRILKSKEIVTVVDAGCGHAHEAILFAALGAEVVGIDLREDGFRVALDNIKRFRSIFTELNIKLINRDLFAAMESLRADIVWVRQAISHIHPAEKFIDVACQTLNKNGMLVINDSNAMNPLVMVETAVEHWKHANTFKWYVTDKYKDPVTNETVPYAVERVLSSAGLRRMFRSSGLEMTALDFTGYVPVSIASMLPYATLGFEASLRRLPLMSHIGMEYTIVGKKM
jgi:SAM-dependent methyltransferase